MAQLFANNAYASLASPASAVDTLITLASGTGARFPTPTGGDYFLATLVGIDANGAENAWEIVKVTARASDVLTVVRAQEGTTAAIWTAGTRIEQRATKGTFDLLVPSTAIGASVQAYDADLSAIAALAGTSGLLKKTAADTWSLDTSAYLTGNQSISISGAATGSGTTAISLTLADSGATAGTYRSVTVNAKGLITGGTNPTTLSGYGITDAQALDTDLTAIAALTGTAGFLKTNGSGTWSVDTAAYLTGNQSISVSGDASGSGTTAISLTLASVATAGTYRSVTVNAKGLVTSGTNPTTLSGYGITDALSNSASSTQSGYFGDIFLYDDSTPSNYLGITNSANLTAARTLSLNVNDADRTVSLSGNLTVSAAATVSGTNSGDQTITLTGDVTGTGSGSFATSISAATVTGKALTGYVSGTNAALAATDTILAAFGKVQGQLDGKTALASPAFTGTPTAPTAAVSTNTTQLATTAFVLGQGNATGTTIAMNGTQAAGSSNLYARADHVHPSDTSRAALASPTFTGTPAAPTAAASTNTTQIATTAFVLGQGNATGTTIAMNGTQSAGSSNLYARADHVHPSDTSRATLASPTFTGTPAAPTAAASTNTTQIATTAFVIGQGNATGTTIAMNGTQSAGSSNLYARADHVHPSDTSRAALASPTFTGTPAAPTAAADTNTTQLATTAYVVGQGYLKSATASSTYLPLTGGSITGNLTFSQTGQRIVADFSNATLSARAAFQTSTTNGTTAVQAIANGTGAASYYVAFAGSDPNNAAYGWLSATTSGMDIYSDKVGTGTVQPIRFLTGGTVRASAGALGGFDLSTGLREARVVMGANDIDLRTGNYFTKTIAGITTLTVSNVPATGTAASFILDLTNGGSATITWWSGMKWVGGTAPTLTAAGRDVLGFFTHDGGTTWTGLVLGKDVK